MSNSTIESAPLTTFQPNITSVQPIVSRQILTYSQEKYTYKVVTDITEGKAIWSLFKRENVLFENWDFLMLFYKEFQHYIKFYVAYEGETPICLVPLNFDSDTGKLESFFSKKAQHPIFVKPGYDDAVEYLLEKISEPINLEYVYFPHAPNWAPEKFSFQTGLYDLDISGFASGEEYLAHINAGFPSKKRIKYNAEYRKTKEQVTDVKVNNLADLDTLFDYNIKAVTMEHYGEVSGFLSENYKNGFRKLLESGFETYLFSLEVAGQVHDIELGLKYGNTLYHLTGSTSREVQNLGKYANLYMIDFAIKSGCTFYNAGTGDYNWKEKLGLKSISLYKYSNI